ncbi:putative extracellular metallo proteinase mep [Amylocarpus encephaloides]|uniref:Extracellular metalloproteinase n=1 Tax=Amylocarpus encephaloides TaxID=45428 RepID=A0A9P7YFB1_9HELO|nr:putative extracellular metallo proteinase mep [Amylocarpus encephaloides]
MRVIAAASAAIVLAGQVLGHPASHAGTALSKRKVQLDKFRLTTLPSYSDATSTDNLPAASLIGKRATYLEAAEALVEKVVPGATFRVADDHYVGSNGIAHVNLKQTIHGLDIDNADFNVNVAADGSIFSFGNSFYTGPVPEASPLTKRDTIDPVAALQGASNVLDLSITATGATAKPEAPLEHYVIEGSTGALSAPKARLQYVLTPEGTLSLVWRVETDVNSDWLLTYVDALDANKVHAAVNYVAEASYTIFPWGVNDPTKGTRKLETDPWDITASPFTWQGDGSTTYTTTRGNNGIAQANYQGDTAYLNDYRPTAAGANFNFDLDLRSTNFRTYSNASVTQLFYSANIYHDLLYKLGFTESAGNFATNNNGKGGRAADEVILNAQDGSGTNNANFATPVDGQKPRMRMYMWTTATPNRDCSFDAGVIIHEYTHGLSNRLTGGPANSGCLSVTEAGGMGEGWGDFMAIAIHVKSTDTRSINYPLGDYVSNNPAGIRAYVYSTSLTTNPLTYRSANGLTSVHSIGTIWATMLYEVMWNLIEKKGNTAARFPTQSSNGTPSDGRFLTMKLVVDGMALQPCSPTFPQARDAIIDADRALTGGANICEIWKGFAKRGLGSGALRGSGNSGRTESYTIPSGVCP